jgi:hypothetical protein
MGITTARKIEDEAFAPPPRDHNRPPLEELIPLEFREALLRERPDFLSLVDANCGVPAAGDAPAIEGAIDRASCTDAGTYERCGKLANALRLMEQHVGATHTEVKAPYLQGGRLVDAEKNALVGRIGNARARVQRMMEDYLAEERRKERVRQAELEAERQRLADLAREQNIAPEVITPALAPEPARKAEPVRTDGATISAGTEWDARVTDFTKAFKHVKNDAGVREAIEKAICRMVKGAKGQITLTGVEVFDRPKVSVR